MAFGVVSLAADMVYEGARSVTGPLLAALGASAVLVGVVSGAGEAMALVLRVVSGSWADRSGGYWRLTFAGYGLTAVSVPALAVTPFLGAAGLAVACTLLLAERVGKAVRSPAKTALLAQAAGAVGVGRGFAVHKALDQVGAVAGPLLVAAVAAGTGAIWPGLAVLVVPGAFSLVVLGWLRRRLVSPAPPPDPDASRSPTSARLPSVFWWFSAAAGCATAGLVGFALIGFHLTREQIVPTAAVPLIYAAAMGAEAVAALATGWLYDKMSGRVLLVLPALIVSVPVLAFSPSVVVVLGGVLLWGAAMGVQDSTVKALVADLVPGGRRATAYGIFAAVQGTAALIGGALAGALYAESVTWLVIGVAASQSVTLVLLVVSLRRPSR